MNTPDIAKHLRTIASRGHTTDEDNQWLFDAADFLDPIVDEEQGWDDVIDPFGDTA